jgi:putative PIN family toxin of toxin-antitoxin system
MKIVLDANIFISAFFWGGKPRMVLKRVIAGIDELFITKEILNEINDVIRRPKFHTDEYEIHYFINSIEEIANKIVVERRIDNGSRDKTDNKYIECGISAHVNYIISEDVYIDINQNYEYTARYIYLIENRGDAIVVPLGFFFRPFPQSGETFAHRPKIVHFKVNDKKINPVIVQTESLPSNDRVVIDVWFDRIVKGWIYTSILFEEDEVVRIELLYNSNYNQVSTVQRLIMKVILFCLKRVTTQ